MSDSFQKRVAVGLDLFSGGALDGMDFLEAKLDSGQGSGASEDQLHPEVIGELCRLLGTMVDSNLRDGSGALNLQVLAQREFKDFDQFKGFLAHQAGLNDHKSFRNPYEDLIAEGRFGRLLRYLYRELNPKQYSLLSPQEAQAELKEFQAALIEIDGEAFARNFANTKEGRLKLNGLLAPDSDLSKDQRADLIKGIYQVGEEKNVVVDVDFARVRDNLSPWNYFNLFVSDGELEVAGEGARSILRSMSFFAEQVEARAAAPKARVTKGGIHRDLDPKKVERLQKLAEPKDPGIGAIAQTKSHLARLWLFAADPRNLSNLGYRTIGSNLTHQEKTILQRQLLKRCEDLIQGAEGIKGRGAFLAYLEKLEGFLNDPIQLPGQNSVLTWLEHQATGMTLSDYLSEMPADIRAPLDQLIQLKDQWKYSVAEMDEAVMLKPLEIKAQDPELQKKVQLMIQGLEQTKHGLWYGYKQHKAINRGISQVADLVNEGDIKEIQMAQSALNSFIYRLSEVDQPEDLQGIHQDLVKALEEGGDLARALAAAEMDGTEQVLGLAQTMAVMAALAMATRGTSLVLQGLRGAAGAGEVAQLTQSTLQTATTLSRAEKMAKGFWLGAGLSTAENALAVTTGEVRQGPELVHKWFKDAVATGMAMGVTAGMIPQFFQLARPQQNLIKNLWARYTAGGLKGLGHLGADTGLEIFEETLDQYLNQTLNGDTSGISEAEFTELALICMAGGGAKVGILKGHLKGENTAAAEGVHPRVDPTEKLEGQIESPAIKFPVTEPANDNAHIKYDSKSQLSHKFPAAAAASFLGLGTLLSPEIAQANSGAGVAILNDSVQSISDVGSGILSQDTLPGFLLTLGLASLGVLAMAKSKGDPKASKVISRSKKKLLKEVYGKHPELETALTHMGWTSKEIYHVVSQVAKMPEHRVSYAFLKLTELLGEFTKTDWDSVQKFQLISLYLEKGSHTYSTVFRSLRDTLKTLETTPWSSQQKFQFLSSVGTSYDKNGITSDIPHLAHQISVLNRTGWGFEEICKGIGLMVEGEFDFDDSALGEFEALLGSLEETSWDSKQVYQYLAELFPRAGDSGLETIRILTQFIELNPESADQISLNFLRLLSKLSDFNRYEVLDTLEKTLLGDPDDEYGSFTDPFPDDHEGDGRTLPQDPSGLGLHLELYVECFERWPRLGFNIMEGLLEALALNVIPRDLSEHHDKIIKFIEQTRSFEPSLYRAYLKEGDPLLARLDRFSQRILNDEMSVEELEQIVQKYNDEFLLGVIRRVSPISGASNVAGVEQLDLLDQFLESGDLRSHIPKGWQGRVEKFNLSQGGWSLKAGEALDPEGRLSDLLKNFRPSKKGKSIEEKDLVQALKKYLESDRDPKKLNMVQSRLYALAGKEVPIQETMAQIQKFDKVSLGLLHQLFADRDNLPHFLKKALDQVPSGYFKGKGETRSISKNPKKLIKSLKKVWEKNGEEYRLPSEKRHEILASLLKSYDPGDIEAKLLTRTDLNPEMKAAIKEVMVQGPDLSKNQLISEILQGPLQLIQQEERKYEYLDTKSVQMGIRAVKGPAFALHGLTSGVCTATDLQLWENPNFKLLAIVDEGEQEVVGYVHAFETIIKGKKYLTLPGMNPSVEILGTVDSQELYAGIMASVIKLAEAGDYQGVYIPTEENIHSNRHDIRDLIKKANYPIKNIPQVDWNSVPDPYPFSEVYVVWERGKGKGGIRKRLAPEPTPENGNILPGNNPQGLNVEINQRILEGNFPAGVAKLNPTNREYFEQSLAQLQGPKAVFHGNTRQEICVVIQEVLDGERPPLDAFSALVQAHQEIHIEFLQNHLLDKQGQPIEAVKGIHRYPLKDSAIHLSEVPSEIQEFLKLFPDSELEVVELEVADPIYEKSTGAINFKKNPSDPDSPLESADTMMRTLMNLKRLGSFYEEWIHPPGSNIWRYPPLPLTLFALQQAHGEKALDFQFTLGTVTLDELRDLLATDRWPLWLATQSPETPAAEGPAQFDVHGDPSTAFRAFMHDFWHGLYWSERPQEAHRAMVRVHDAIKAGVETLPKAYQQHRLWDRMRDEFLSVDYSPGDPLDFITKRLDYAVREEGLPEEVKQAFLGEAAPRIKRIKESEDPSLLSGKGTLLTSLGTGLATILSPEIAKAYSGAGVAVLSDSVPSISDVGSTMAGHGLGAGLLTALGMAGLGMLGMAINRSRKPGNYRQHPHHPGKALTEVEVHAFNQSVLTQSPSHIGEGEVSVEEMAKEAEEWRKWFFHNPFQLTGNPDANRVYGEYEFNSDGTIRVEASRFHFGRKPRESTGVLIELAARPPVKFVKQGEFQYFPLRMIAPKAELQKFKQEPWYENWFMAPENLRARAHHRINPLRGVTKQLQFLDLKKLSQKLAHPLLKFQLRFPLPNGKIDERAVLLGMDLQEDRETAVGAYPGRGMGELSFVQALLPIMWGFEFTGAGMEYHPPDENNAIHTIAPDFDREGSSYHLRDIHQVQIKGFPAAPVQFYLRRKGDQYEIRQGKVKVPTKEKPGFWGRWFGEPSSPQDYPTTLNGKVLDKSWVPLKSGDEIQFGPSKITWLQP